MVKQWQIEISNEASNDLRQIANYLAITLQSPDTARNIPLLIIDEIKQLNPFPSRHPLYSEEPWHSRGVRFFIVKNYIVFYHADVQTNEILVLRIMHKRQNHQLHLQTNF